MRGKLLAHVAPLLAVLGAAVLADLPVAAGTPRSQDEYGFQGGPWVGPEITAQRLRPRSLSGKNGSQSWSYVFRFADRTLVRLEFLVTNLGPGEHTGVFMAYIVEPDGAVTHLRNTRREGIWEDRSDDERVELWVAYHTLQIDHPVHRVRVEHPDRGRMEIEARVVTEAFDPGLLRLPGEGVYEVTVPAPRLRAEGWIELPGQERRRLVDGRGIGVHVWTEVADNRLATGWLRIDGFGSAPEASLFELMTSRRHARRRIGFLLEFDGDRLAGHTFRYGRRLVDVSPDPDKKDYPLAAGLRFGADSELQLRAEGNLELLVRSPLLDALNSGVLRSVLRMLADPILYLYRAPYTIRREDDAPGDGGEALVSLYLLDDPPPVY